MTETAFRPEDEDDLLAAEYVAGMLDLAERTGVEARLRMDAGFAALVTQWEIRFQDLNDDYPEVPAPDFMPTIEARLFPSAAKPGLWSNLWAWGAAVTAAVAVVAYLALTPAAPSFVATLEAEGSVLRYEAVITQDRLTITRVSGATAGADHAHELWIIAGDNPPVSLGVISGDSETIALPGVTEGAVLAITVEPAGGSPTGMPTTTPVAVGTLTAA